MKKKTAMKRVRVLKSGALPLVLTLLLPYGCGNDGKNAAGKESGSEASGESLSRVADDDSTLQRQGGLLYRNGRPFSGTVVESYADGNVKSLTPYVGGRQEGVARGWYPDRTAMFERFYVAGKRQGTHRTWWENGAPQSVFHFRNDLHEESAVEWFSDGTLYREFHYKAGREAGRQRMWNQDGTLRANYVVVNGRRYGSMGSKPCLSRSTDERQGEPGVTGGHDG